MAVDDLTGDGRPEIVIADERGNAVMVYCNASRRAAAAGRRRRSTTPPPSLEDAGRHRDRRARQRQRHPDGRVFIAAVTQPAHGSVALAGGALTYRPAADYCNDLGGTPDTFTYTLNGGSTRDRRGHRPVRATTCRPSSCSGVSRHPPPPPPPPPAFTADLRQPGDHGLHRRHVGQRRPGRGQLPQRPDRPGRRRLPVRQGRARTGSRAGPAMTGSTATPATTGCTATPATTCSSAAAATT